MNTIGTTTSSRTLGATTSSMTGVQPTAASGSGSSTGKPSAIDTLAKELGIPPNMMKELLKAELEKKHEAQSQGAQSQGGGSPAGQANNLSGESGDLNGDGVVNEQDMELLAKQKLAEMQSNGQGTSTSATGGIDGASSGMSASTAGAPSGAIA